jgi:hypothetical protein
LLIGQIVRLGYAAVNGRPELATGEIGSLIEVILALDAAPLCASSLRVASDVGHSCSRSGSVVSSNFTTIKQEAAPIGGLYHRSIFKISLYHNDGPTFRPGTMIVPRASAPYPARAQSNQGG